MNLLKVKTLIFSALLFLSGATFADPVHFTLKAETASVQPGTPFWLALDLSIDKTWHAYWKNPGEAGMPPQIEWKLPPGFVVQAIEWPYPSRFNIGSAYAFGYSGQTILLAKILPSADFKQSEATVQVDIRWVVCNDETCLPGASQGSIALPVHEGLAQINKGEELYFQAARSKLPKKTDSLKTKKENDLLESVVKTGDTLTSEALSQAQFFPENSQVAVTVSSHPTLPDQIVLTYREERDTPPLKGVLVIGEKSYAVDMEESGELAYNETTSSPHETSQVLENYDKLESLPLALLFAFLGGMILNLMPCVLPVVSLKVLSFVNLAKECTFTRIKHGLYFTLGILISFWTLAGLMLLLQAWGKSIGWGFQLQEPLFVAILACIMLIFALSLFGVFEMGAIFASWAGSWAGQKEARGSRGKEGGALAAFFSGVLATAVATPCTGPFLGSAIGYAFTLTPLWALTIFTFLALGMALPYLLLTTFPPLLRFVPRPGCWMETFKQAMGFLMLLATLWLTWVFSSETTDPASTMLLAAYFIIAVACWIIGKGGTPVSSLPSRLSCYGAALILFGLTFKTLSLAAGFALPSSAPAKETNIASAEGGWEPFSTSRIEELRAKGIPVFIDFTAKWCLICQANHLTLSTHEVEKKMVEKGVVKMKADWTKNDPEITAELKKWGRSGVPLYVLYGPETAKILPQVLTSDGVIASLDELPHAN